MGNYYQIFKTTPHLDPKKNISFGGQEEKEMIQKFNAFNILWYAPKDSEKLEEWIAFTNIEVIKVSEEKIFLNQAISSCIIFPIIIITGSLAEKIIPKIFGKFPLPKIIIYCMNVDYHKKWSEKYNIIEGVFDHPSQIFHYLLECQKHGYDIPIFSYKIFNLKEFNFNCYEGMNNEEIFVNKNNYSLKLNLYQKFLVHNFHDLRFASLNIDNYYNKFISKLENLLNLFYKNEFFNINIVYAIYNLPFLKKEADEILQFLTGLTLFSLYFSKFPYLYGVLEYEEIEKILLEEYYLDDLRKEYQNLINSNIIQILTDKLMKEKISILEDITNLKILHIFLIKFIKLYLTSYKFEYDSFSKFPLMIKYLMDLDFCLKFCFLILTTFLDSKSVLCERITFDEDKRIDIFLLYGKMNLYKINALKYISEENLEIMNETLRIRDFIVIGNEKFFQKIKNIEKYFAHKKIAYLSINQVKDYLLAKKDEKYRNFFYFFIISSEEANIYFKEIYSIRYDFGLMLSLIIYNENKKIFINKMPFIDKEHLSIFFAYNTNEIIAYINGQENLNCGSNFMDSTLPITELFENIQHLKLLKFPEAELKIEDKNDKLSSEEGWELVEFVPEEIFKIKFLDKRGEILFSDLIRLNLHEIYKENKIETLFYNTYCKYFFYNLIPELLFNPIKIGLSHLCYAYSLHEDKDSFFYIMNRDLRLGISSKIEKYISIIATINLGIKEEFLKSYKGKLFRATKMKEEMIEKKIIEGKTLTNLSFWSASKERKIAENYLADPFRNIIFNISSVKCNIDMEEISKFNNEKEVLFLPYSKFLIKSKEKKILKNKEVYEVQLEGLDDENERKDIKSFSVVNEFLDYLLK